MSKTISTRQSGPSTVSVILPTHNRAPLLSRAIRSIQDQTFPDWTLWIIDDASTDSTAEVVHAFSDSRIRYIRLTHQRGPSVARNRGILSSDSPYITFLDSDDELPPHSLGRKLETLQSLPPSYGLVYTDMIKIFDRESGAKGILEQNGFPSQGSPSPRLRRIFDQPSPQEGKGDHRKPKAFGYRSQYYSVGESQKKHPVSLFYPHLYHIPIGWMVRREIFRTGEFFDTLKSKSHEDFDLLIHISKRFQLYYLSEPLYICHTSEQETLSATSTPSVHSLKNGLKGTVHLLTRYQEEFRRNPLIEGSWLALMSSYFKYLGMKGQAIRTLMKAFRTDRKKDHLSEIGLLFLGATRCAWIKEKIRQYSS